MIVLILEKNSKISSRRDFLFKALFIILFEDEGPSFLGKWEQMDCAGSSSEWNADIMFLAGI